jgi:hypothetical protein
LRSARRAATSTISARRSASTRRPHRKSRRSLARRPAWGGTGDHHARCCIPARVTILPGTGGRSRTGRRRACCNDLEIDVPAGFMEDCVVNETTPLEPGSVSTKV